MSVLLWPVSAIVHHLCLLYIFAELFGGISVVLSHTSILYAQRVMATCLSCFLETKKNVKTVKGAGQ